MRPFFRIAATLSLAAGSLAAQKAVEAKPPEPVSPSSLVNSYLPKWIRFGGEHRTRLEGYSGLGYRPSQNDIYWLNRTRLSLNIKPAPWVHFYGELQDARVTARRPGQPPPDNLWDIHQAFVEMGSSDKSRWWLKAGRQEIVIADSRIMGNINWANANRTFDAVRAAWRSGGSRIELFTASVVVNESDTWDHHQQGNNIHGVYTEFTNLVPGTAVQPYFIWRTQPRVRNEAGRIANVNEFTPGIRIAGKLPKAFDYTVEMTHESGSVGSDRIRGWMGHWELGRTWKKARFSPRFWGEYNYTSGDANPTDGVRGTYDPLYAALHDKFGFADQIAGRNLKDIRGGVEAKLPHGIGAMIEFNDWRLASRFDGVYTAQALVARSPSGTAGTHVGTEVDLITTWKMRGPVQAGAGLGYIIPGEFLKNTTPGKRYIYPFIVFTYKL